MDDFNNSFLVTLRVFYKKKKGLYTLSCTTPCLPSAPPDGLEPSTL